MMTAFYSPNHLLTKTENADKAQIGEHVEIFEFRQFTALLAQEHSSQIQAFWV